MSGAVDLEACPDRNFNGRAACRCKPKCRVCGFGMHMAIHGPLLGEEPGSKPWGHEFKPRPACVCVDGQDARELRP